MKDINEVSVEILESLSKSNLTPNMRKQLMAYLGKIRKRSPHLFNSANKKALLQHIIKKAEEILSLEELKKHEAMVTLYKSGSFKFDFGEEVPDKIKKMAIDWAKKRGLLVSEESLNKSSNAKSTITFGIIDECDEHIKTVKFF